MNTATASRAAQAVTSAGSAAAAVAHSVPLRQDATVIGLVGLAHATSHFFHMLLAPLFPVFIKEYGLSFSEVGLLTTAFFVVSGLGQASAGFVVDRFGARPVLFAALCCFALAALVAAGGNGYSSLLLASVLAGVGNAPFHPVDFTILNQRVSSERLGYAYSAHGLTGNLGWAVAPVFFVGITALAGWRSAYVAAALLALGVLALLVFNRDKLRSEVVVHAPLADGRKSSDLDFLKLPVVWWCFAFFLLSTMTLAVIQGFSSSILKAVHGISFEAATAVVTAYMLCGALGMAVGGWVAVHHSGRSERVVALSMTAGAALLAICATGVLGAVGTMVAMAATGFAVGVGGPSRDMMIRKATPKGATGRVYGAVYSGLDVGFALSPILFGAFMDRGWYGATLAGAAVVLLLSVGAALGVGKRTAR